MHAHTYIILKIEIEVTVEYFLKISKMLHFIALETRNAQQRKPTKCGINHFFLLSSHWQLQPLWQRNDIPALNGPRKVLSSLYLGKLAKNRCSIQEANGFKEVMQIRDIG